MLLTVFCLRRDRSELTFSLQVDPEFELQNFRALCELESGIPAAESQIVFAERPLTDNHRSLSSYGLKDGDVVLLQEVDNAEAPFPGLPRIDFSSIAVPGTSNQPQPPPAAPASQRSPPELPSSPQGLDNPALLRDMLLANPHELSLLKERNPPLAEALLSGDLERFTRVLVEQQQDRARRERERIRLFSADPFDLEAQAKIEEDIRQQNIEENMTIAMEEAPESFGQVVMLYINCKVNGHPVKAFVDSGAQMTIMSQACAERCNIMRLVDRRWAGIAKGVGTQKIIGRVHLAQVQIEGDFLPCSFSILEEQPMDMLLGLDMLKRHQCSIDLKKNVLVIGTTGSQTTFLPEGELPECARLAYGPGREDLRPEDIADQELAEAIQKSVEEAEYHEKATTSPEMPLLPTCGRPLRSASISNEIGLRTDPSASRVVGRPASAPPSVCSLVDSQAEPVSRRAAWSVDLPVESPEESPLALLDASDHAACATIVTSLPEEPGPGASRGPHPPLRCIPDHPPLSGSLEEFHEGDEPPVSPMEAAVERVFSSTRKPEILEAAFTSESLKPNQRSSLRSGLLNLSGSVHDSFPGDADSKPTGEEQPCSMEASLSPTEREQLFVEKEGAGEGEGRQPGSAPSVHPEGEAFLDVVVVEEETLIVSGRQEVGLPLGSSPMEVDWSQQDPPWVIDLLPGDDLMPPETSIFVETDAASASVTLSTASSDGQLSSLEEELCPSLTSTLKELHQLLVERCNGNSQEEHSCQSAGACEEPVVSAAAAEEELECPRGGCPSPYSGGGEASPGVCLPEEPVESLAGQGALRVAARSGQEALALEEPLGLTGPLVLSSSAASSPLQVHELPEISRPCLFSGQSSGHRVLGQNQQLSILPQAPVSRGAEGSVPAGPVILGVEGSPAESSPPSPVNSAAPESPPPFPVSFAAADIERIVGFGFTPHEAGEALARVGGNADLALLLLLAKKIVVPR